jgi:hypothetical protein
MQYILGDSLHALGPNTVDSAPETFKTGSLHFHETNNSSVV